VHTELWCENLTEKDHFESPGMGSRITFGRFLRKWIGGLLVGLIWFRIVTRGGHLTRNGTFGCRKICAVS